MIYPWIPIMYPKFNPINEKPPTLYAMLNSIVNFGNEKPVKIKDLASAARTEVFDFTYPLSVKINREEFETLILNKFLMRRIGFETFTAFQIQLNVKLNEIMPFYNKMFDMLDGWDLFTDGEVVTHESEGVRDLNINSTNDSVGNSTSDMRYSDTPQNRIEDVKNGNYITNYTFNEVNNKDNNILNTKTKDNNLVKETTRRSPAEKINVYKEFLETKQNIYTMIFKDLECLFYGIF